MLNTTEAALDELKVRQPPAARHALATQPASAPCTVGRCYVPTRQAHSAVQTCLYSFFSLLSFFSLFSFFPLFSFLVPYSNLTCTIPFDCNLSSRALPSRWQAIAALTCTELHRNVTYLCRFSFPPHFSSFFFLLLLPSLPSFFPLSNHPSFAASYRTT